MTYSAKKIFALALTSIYMILALVSPFAVFHRHQMALQETSKQDSRELHDSSCDLQDTAHIHLSDHCAACQFASTKTDSHYILDLLDSQTASDHLFFHFILPSCSPHLSQSAGRAPPFFLS